MHDHGMLRRSSLDGEDSLHGFDVACVRAESVHRFGGKRDQAAFAQTPCSEGDVLGRGGNDQLGGLAGGSREGKI